MNLKNIGIVVSITAGIVAIWYYLKGTPTQNLVTYPNTQASGQQPNENPATVYNIAAPSPMPSPNLIYGTPPPLPQTPAYQNYNYSPSNLLGLTPQAAASATIPAPASGSGCGCGTSAAGSSCGCGGCAQTNGTYQDSSGQTCLASNPAQQVMNAPPALFAALQSNINSSAVGNYSGTISGASPNTPLSATAIKPQAQGLAQGQAGVSPTQDPPLVLPVGLTWQSYSSATSVNSMA
jgi:hypothetical protein